MTLGDLKEGQTAFLIPCGAARCTCTRQGAGLTIRNFRHTVRRQLLCIPATILASPEFGIFEVHSTHPCSTESRFR
jgi:hypothetical protein